MFGYTSRLNCLKDTILKERMDFLNKNVPILLNSAL